MSYGKVALVTGSSHGIGKATAIQLAKAGYDLAVTYRGRPKGAEEAAQLIRNLGRDCIVIGVDIADLDSMNAMYDRIIDHYGRLDLCVNNAGVVGLSSPFLETKPELFDTFISVSLRGSYFSAQRAANEMIKCGAEGVIVNVSSNHAVGNFPDCSAYAAAKAGLTKMSRNIAMELAPRGVRVVVVQPGYTDVGWGEGDSWDKGDPIYKAEKKIPLGRFASCQEIADAIVFLASDKAGYITGAVLDIDGGALLPCVPENMFDGDSLLRTVK